MISTLFFMVFLLCISELNFSQKKYEMSFEAKSRLMSDSLRQIQSEVFYQQHKAIMQLSK